MICAMDDVGRASRERTPELSLPVFSSKRCDGARADPMRSRVGKRSGDRFAPLSSKALSRAGAATDYITPIGPTIRPSAIFFCSSLNEA